MHLNSIKITPVHNELKWPEFKKLAWWKGKTLFKQAAISLCTNLHSTVTYLPFSPLSASGSRTLNSVKPLCSHPQHAMAFISSACLSSPFSDSLKTQFVYARGCVCVWMPLWCLPNRLKMFPEPYLPPLPAGQHCCLRLWAGLELHQTGNLRVALVIQASPCLIPHKQTPTPQPPAPTPPHPPSIFSPQLSFASPTLIGLTAAHSPHLLVGIGWRLFPFLDGRGQGTLGYRVLQLRLTWFTVPAVHYESQLPLPSPPPLSPSLL